MSHFLYLSSVSLYPVAQDRTDDSSQTCTLVMQLKHFTYRDGTASPRVQGCWCLSP